MRENLDIDTKTLALYYAWDHFAYHAQQRQTVFNFFLLLVGGCVAAYASTMGQSGGGYFRIFLGAVLALASLLFWRLDQRNARLVKVSEEALKKLEARMADEIKEPTIRLIANAEKRVAKFPFSKIESFGQIYGLVFAVSGLVGIAMAILSAAAP